MNQALFFFCLLPIFSLFGGLNEQHDFQLWTAYSLKWKIGNATLMFENEERFGDNSSELFLYYFQGGLSYGLSSYVDFAGGYRQINVRFFREDDWQMVYDPLFYVTLKSSVGPLQIHNRNLVQYFITKDFPNTWQYRNRTTLIFSKRWGRTRYHPLFSQEFFFRENGGYAENRMEFGGISYWGKGSSYSLLYLWELFKTEERWITAHVLRVKLEFVF